jgi:quinolinate synthase
VEDIATARQRYPEAKIIVHPETPAPVMRLADAHGSTSQIIKYVEKAPDGATIVIGTEYNLVKRLTEQHKNRLTIVPLRISGCRDMALTTEEKLYRVLQNRPSENIVRIPAEYRADAKAALQRMLDIS